MISIVNIGIHVLFIIFLYVYGTAVLFDVTNFYYLTKLILQENYAMVD